MAEPVYEIRGLKIALSSYVVLFALQLTTYFMTGILVLFAQALEVLSDVVVSAFLLFSGRGNLLTNSICLAMVALRMLQR